MLFMGNRNMESGINRGRQAVGVAGVAGSGPAGLLSALMISAALFISGCAHQPFPQEAWEFPYPPKEPPAEDTILDVRTGYAISPDQLIDLLHRQRCLLVRDILRNPEGQTG